VVAGMPEDGERADKDPDDHEEDGVIPGTEGVATGAEGEKEESPDEIDDPGHHEEERRQ